MTNAEIPQDENEKLLCDELLPIELTNGNDGRGFAFWSSAKEREKIEATLRLAGFKREPFLGPVVVEVTRILGKGQRKWDTSSIGRGNWKEIEDSLVALGWFVDDSPKYITETRFRQDSGQRDRGPSVRVRIWGDRQRSLFHGKEAKC